MKSFSFSLFCFILFRFFVFFLFWIDDVEAEKRKKESAKKWDKVTYGECTFQPLLVSQQIDSKKFYDTKSAYLEHEKEMMEKKNNDNNEDENYLEHYFLKNSLNLIGKRKGENNRGENEPKSVIEKEKFKVECEILKINSGYYK